MLGSGCRSLDVDPCAVHVHLTVSDFIEPGPGEESSARRCVAGNSEVVVGSQWAGTDDALDHAEGRAVVVGKRDLTRATAVSGTASKCDVVFGASLESSGRANWLL